MPRLFFSFYLGSGTEAYWPRLLPETIESLLCLNSKWTGAIRFLFLPQVHKNRSHITAATVVAATVWWAAHGLLPLCTPLHTPFACLPAPPSAPPSMAPTETQHKIQQGEVKPENPPLQDQILDPEQSEVLQA